MSASMLLIISAASSGSTSICKETMKPEPSEEMCIRDRRRPVGYWINQYDIEGWSLNDPVYVEAKDVYFYKSKRCV